MGFLEEGELFCVTDGCELLEARGQAVVSSPQDVPQTYAS